MKILLIYESVPESTNFYVLNLDPADEKVAVLNIAHGHLINYDMPDEAQEACEKISQALSKPEHIPAEDDQNKVYEGWGSIWLDSEIAIEELPTAGPFDKVFWTGFGM